MCYGVGRLYFHLTAGFQVANIIWNEVPQIAKTVRTLSLEEEKELHCALSQPYFYLGKGCQSYVFESQDGQYVVKFFKYQRYRLPSFLNWLPPLPAVVAYRQEKSERKKQKLRHFMQSWQLAFEELKEETGLVYVHLHPTSHLQEELVIHDKLGMRHLLFLDQMEFCIQRRADMLCDRLLAYKQENHLEKGCMLIDALLELITSEYHRGLGDNDHALMQNTGVHKEKPVHIDVGQFVRNESFCQTIICNQEIFTKTYKFNKWLKEHIPELSRHLESRLREMMGEENLSQMQPRFRQK